jgi:PmbA protein
MAATRDTESQALSFLTDLVAKARKAGADAADAVAVEGVSLSVSQRLGAREDLQRSESRDLGLRVFVGRKSAIVSATDRSPQAIAELVERAVAMARLAPEDPHAGLADPALLASSLPDLDLYDTAEPDAERLYGKAAEAEDVARAVTGITNSEGADASWGRSTVALATSHGYAGSYSGSRHSVSVSVIAGEGTAMERDYDFTSARHESDLDEPAKLGRNAAEKVLKRLNPRRMASGQFPIVFDPRVSNGLLGHLAGAVNGQSVARKTSFLRDARGTPVFAPGVSVIDDPHRKRGQASRPVDGEGVATRPLTLIDNGVLTGWILDTASAHQLGLTTTGHASRGTSGPPGPSTSNLYMQAGKLSPKELMADIASGFYVTELIGFGVNGVTGDYSRGAAGFWIEKGEIVFPVNEITIAGNLKDMFRQLTPANDLVFRYGTNAPTVRIEGMTVAGAG